MPNQSTEDYIKGIYKLAGAGMPVATSALAKHLRVGDGSVTDMLKKLSEKKLIRYTPYQGVGLTPAGKKLALKMMRRHRLWEMYLVRFLSYGWDEVHEEAERLEHVLSEKMEQRIDQALGFPQIDPHGDPIPTADGNMPDISYRTLDECAVGELCTIVRVNDESPEMLQYLKKIGLHLNRKVRIRARIQYDGSVIIGFESKEIPLSVKLAKNIFVRE